MPLAVCDLCRRQGGCLYGFLRLYRYFSTQPAPVTGWKRTKMCEVINQTKKNGGHPPVETLGGRSGRFIVGASMCSYVRSLGTNGEHEQKAAPAKSSPLKKVEGAAVSQAPLQPPPTPVVAPPRRKKPARKTRI